MYNLYVLVYRGCGKHFCADQKICLECTTDACNGHSQAELEPSQCLVCDSENPFCANGTAPSSYCEYLDEPCYSMVRESKYLIEDIQELIRSLATSLTP